MAEIWPARVQHEGSVIRLCIQGRAQHIDHPEQRPGRLAPGIGQRRQRVEGAEQV